MSNTATRLDQFFGHLVEGSATGESRQLTSPNDNSFKKPQIKLCIPVDFLTAVFGVIGKMHFSSASLQTYPSSSEQTHHLSEHDDIIDLMDRRRLYCLVERPDGGRA
jgi:hypothetical protein